MSFADQPHLAHNVLREGDETEEGEGSHGLPEAGRPPLGQQKSSKERAREMEAEEGEHLKQTTHNDLEEE